MTSAARRVPGASRVIVTVTLAVALSAAGGCARPSTDDVEEPRAPTADAIDACLRAAVEHSRFPLEDSSGLAVAVERDDQEWWAVSATIGEGASALTLTCTAVPEDDGARASSWSVAPAE